MLPLDRILEADLQLSSLSQMSMVVIFVSFINKRLLGKGLAILCSVSVYDDLNGVSGIFLVHLLGFIKEMVWLKNIEAVKGLNDSPRSLMW